MSLTADTSKTLRGGGESLVKYLLSKDIKYIMLGDMQSDRIEGEFGAYRQLNGGNYYMSADHVQNALKLHRIKLFSSLEVDDIVMESSTLFLSNTINLELHGFFAQRDLFPFIWTPRTIFTFFITFTQYKLTIHPPVIDRIHCIVK